uniref:DUF8173 domain-containing protein n=1 Tax=candidate division WOR-3 bacterium TaxID=2052148 RepID=A0A7V1EI83_UNCW3
MKAEKIIIIFTIILALSVPGNALVFKSGRDIVIGSDEVIDDDLIATARKVKIDGRVNGDVFAFAQEVIISGTINGSIYTGGSEIKYNAKNCRSIWAFCGSLQTDGNIENNLLFFGGQLKTEKNTLIKKDLIAYGGEVNIDGEIQGIVKGEMGRFNLNGKIGSANIGANKTSIKSGSSIMGDLFIKGKNEPQIDPDAKILGKTEYKKIEEKDGKHKNGGFGGFIKTIFFISRLIIGIILIALFKPFITKTNEILRNSTWKSLGFGFLTIITIPVAMVITLITVIGIPISIFCLFLFLTIAYLSGIVFATGFGEVLIRLIKREGAISPFISFILGIIIVSLVSLIPYLSFFLRLATLFFGTGMLVILFNNLWKKSINQEA